MVLQTGEIPKGLYYLYSGMCRIVKAEDQILRRVTGGNFFGEVYYFFGGEAKVSVIAEDEVQIYVLDRLLIEKALTRNPSLGFPLYKSMALQIS